MFSAKPLCEICSWAWSFSLVTFGGTVKVVIAIVVVIAIIGSIAVKLTSYRKTLLEIGIWTGMAIFVLWPAASTCAISAGFTWRPDGIASKRGCHNPLAASRLPHSQRRLWPSLMLVFGRG